VIIFYNIIVSTLDKREYILPVMNAIELLNELRSKGFELTEISQKTGISFQTLNQIKRGITKKPRAYNGKALADAFGYDLKYEHGEPQFYKKEESPPAIRANPETRRADEIYAYLKDNGINSLEELHSFFEFLKMKGLFLNQIKAELDQTLRGSLLWAIYEIWLKQNK